MPPLLAAAIPAVIGAGTAIYAGSQQTKAANKALAAQQQASNQQLQLQQEQWQRAQDVNQPWMNAGGAALSSLSGRLGLTPQVGAPTRGGGAAQPQAQQQDWGSYVQQHPDVAAGYDAYSKGSAQGFGGANEGQNWGDWGYQPGLSQDQFAQQFQEKTGQGAGYTVPTTAQAPATGPDAGQEPTFQRPDALPAPTAERPTFQRPPDQPLPTFQRPDQGSFTDPGGPADFQFDASKIGDDPGYQFRQKEAMKQVNAGFGARGLLQSGFALRGAIDRSSDVASQETANAFARQMAAYSANAANAKENRNFAYNQFNNDRNNSNTNFNSDRSYGTTLALDQQQRGDNIFSQDRAYGNDAFNGDRSYNTNLWQYNNDNQTRNFETDRSYGTGREDNRTANLFQLAGMGQSAANSSVGAGSNFANNAGNIYGNQADAATLAVNQRAGANAGMVGAVGGAIASGVNRYNWGGMSPATAVGTESISRMPVQTNVSGLNVFNPGRVF